MQEKDNIVSVPFVVYEGERARAERLLTDERERHDQEKKDERVKWFIVVLVLLFLLFGSNAAWIVYEAQYQKVQVSQEVEQDAYGDGENTFVGGDYFGAAEGENDSPNAG